MDNQNPYTPYNGRRLHDHPKPSTPTAVALLTELRDLLARYHADVSFGTDMDGFIEDITIDIQDHPIFTSFTTTCLDADGLTREIDFLQKEVVETNI